MDVVIQDCKIWLPGQDNLQNSKSYFQLFYQKYPCCHLKTLPNNGKYPLGQSISYHSNFISMLSILSGQQMNKIWINVTICQKHGIKLKLMSGSCHLDRVSNYEFSVKCLFWFLQQTWKSDLKVVQITKNDHFWVNALL